MIHCAVCERREPTSAPALMLFKKQRKIEQKRKCKTAVNLVSSQKLGSADKMLNFEYVRSQLSPSLKDADHWKLLNVCPRECRVSEKKGF